VSQRWGYNAASFRRRYSDATLLSSCNINVARLVRNRARPRHIVVVTAERAS
jgi:hypothetical protein